ncbi:MAG: hypothetical protein IID18_06745, partial [Nitrospinae bacterium]|nr:hypothetical protein [Nitrospinota bacterium]
LLSYTQATESKKKLYYSGPVVLDASIKFNANGRANGDFHKRHEDIWLKASDLLTKEQRTIYVSGYSDPITTTTTKFKQIEDDLEKGKGACAE